jgi:O-antigen biosynthesis protein
VERETQRAASPGRRSGAPRLIGWTGERFVPWAPDVQVAYEHYHRYLWTQPLVAGRRVLDLGSGEGYGAALLAQSASAVTGVDVDERAVAHSRANYPGVEFHAGSATDLSAFGDGAFDAVVAFEMIEHVAEHDQVVAEIARVLAPGGLVVMSTPERRAYSDDRDFSNPYHARELTQEEFTALLGSRFGSVALFAQRAVAGSRLEALEPAPGHLAVRIARTGEDWEVAAAPEPLYLVAVASDGPLPDLPGESTLIDYGLEVLAERDARFRAELEAKNDLLVAEQARAQRAEDEARRVTESVSWRALERLRGVIGPDSFAGRRVRALTSWLFARGSRRSAGPRG